MKSDTTQRKIDLVMWTKNGAETLPYALKRIEQVIPKEFVNQKIIVDDKSFDDTIKIAESLGWHFVPNEKTGISSGANTALKYVTTEFFASFEQDILLAPDWWIRVPPSLENRRVAVASGLRFLNKPIGVAKLDQYEVEKYRAKSQPQCVEPTKEGGLIGKTLDNTIYKTEIIKSLGGFPETKTNSGVDTVLAYKLWNHAYHWAVNCDVKSVHIRIGGLREELSHSYRCARELNEVSRALAQITSPATTVSEKNILYRFLVSPVSALRVAIKTREPTIVIVHPLIRLCYVTGVLEGKSSNAQPKGS